MLKVLCQDPGERLASLREVGTAVVAFLVEYVAVFVVSKNLVEVELASDTDDLPAGVTAADIVAVTGVVFYYDYIVCADCFYTKGFFGPITPWLSDHLEAATRSVL